MKYLIILLLILSTSTCFAAEIHQDTIEKRIQQLEQEKKKLETIYQEILVRIDELRVLIQPKEEKKDEVIDKQ